MRRTHVCLFNSPHFCLRKKDAVSQHVAEDASAAPACALSRIRDAKISRVVNNSHRKRKLASKLPARDEGFDFFQNQAPTQACLDHISLSNSRGGT